MCFFAAIYRESLTTTIPNKYSKTVKKRYPPTAVQPCQPSIAQMALVLPAWRSASRIRSAPWSHARLGSLAGIAHEREFRINIKKTVKTVPPYSCATMPTMHRPNGSRIARVALRKSNSLRALGRVRRPAGTGAISHALWEGGCRALRFEMQGGQERLLEWSCSRTLQ